ncbi:MAG: hypothetical protein ACTSUK_04500, partial [Promethearchaeota archaeon]
SEMKESRKKHVLIKKEMIIDNCLLTHGHRKIIAEKKFDTIIISHNHPYVKFIDKNNAGYFEPVWVKGYLNQKEIVIMPAFNELCGATIVNHDKLIGPLAKKMKKARVFLLDGTDLGYVDDLRVDE